MKYLTLIFICSLLAACSSGKGGGSASFEVTKAFASQNSDFPGGLFIHGKNASTGEEFSVALLSEQKSTVTISYGTWDIRVVGWENELPFEGNSVCGHEKINFADNNQKISIKVSGENCKSETFTTLNADSNQTSITEMSPYNGTAFRFKPIELSTCGVLYDLNNSAQLRDANFSSFFCTEYPSNLRRKALGVKISLMNLANGNMQEGISSTCIPANQGSDFGFYSNKNIPTKMPFKISFYESEDCSSLFMKDTYFLAGMDNKLTRVERRFDYIYHSTYSTNMLAVGLGVGQSRFHPSISKVNVYKNGAIYTGINFAPGDLIRITAEGVDPRGKPLQYKFNLNRNCSLYSTLQDWSANNDFSYTFVVADITNCSSIGIGLKNDDGIDFDSTVFGDFQKSISVNVRDGREPAQLLNYTKYKNGTPYGGNDYGVGDQIKIVLNATDPLALPIDYVFYIFRNCSLAATLKPWDGTNEITYTFVNEDLTNCTNISFGVKNNDGLDMDSSVFGDAQGSVGLNMVDPRMPPLFAGFQVFKNSVPFFGTDFQVGDEIRIVANANDPNALPVQYVFYLFVNCSLNTTLQSWSPVNEVTYTFTAPDVSSCTMISVGIKNNDGLEPAGGLHGDLQQNYSMQLEI